MNKIIKPISLCPWSLAFSFAIMWSISVFCLTFINYQRKPTFIIESIHQLYFGASPKSPTGKIILTISAFFDAFIGGLVLGYLYNSFSQKA